MDSSVCYTLGGASVLALLLPPEESTTVDQGYYDMKDLAQKQVFLRAEQRSWPGVLQQQ